MVNRVAGYLSSMADKGNGKPIKAATPETTPRKTEPLANGFSAFGRALIDQVDKVRAGRSNHDICTEAEAGANALTRFKTAPIPGEVDGPFAKICDYLGIDGEMVIRQAFLIKYGTSLSASAQPAEEPFDVTVYRKKRAAGADGALLQQVVLRWGKEDHTGSP